MNGTCRPVLSSQSDDQGTRKLLIGLADGLKIETVLIREKDHYTFCLSTQVGCALACRFCATGTMGFRRNLSAGEIVSQVLTLKKELGEYAGKLNLVFMGMGEPLLNYDNLSLALRRIIAVDGLNISPRHVTVSTVGILENLKKLEHDFPLVKIAFSLNAPNNDLRAELMPVSRRENLDGLLAYFQRAKTPPAHHLRICAAARRQRFPGPGPEAGAAAARHPGQGQPHPLQRESGSALPAPRRNGGGKIPRRTGQARPDRDYALVQGPEHPFGLRPAGRSSRKSLIFGLGRNII